MAVAESSTIALRMQSYIEAEDRGRASLYFKADGRPLIDGGRRFGQDNRSTAAGAKIGLGRSMQAAFIIEADFRPSLASLDDMVSEHHETKRPVIYDDDRWRADPRVDEQISVYGPDVVDDWKLEGLMDAMDRRGERKVAA